jgi:hypothetical protein
MRIIKFWLHQKMHTKQLFEFLCMPFGSVSALQCSRNTSDEAPKRHFGTVTKRQCCSRYSNTSSTLVLEMFFQGGGGSEQIVDVTIVEIKAT